LHELLTEAGKERLRDGYAVPGTQGRECPMICSADVQDAMETDENDAQ